MPAQTRLFLCLKDNFGVLVHDPESGATAAIDAPEAAPVEAALQATGWRLTDILVTHHHHDHTGGIEELKERYGCRVVAPEAEADGIPEVDETVRADDTVRVGGLEARVLETPGHTAGHITYFFPADKLCFAGDTLFSIGCGRVIEGNAEMMWQSLVEAARAAGRHPRLLRPRIHGGEHPLCEDHRAGQRGAGGARARSGAARRREEADNPLAAGRGKGRQSVPARRRAGSGRQGRPRRQAGLAGVRGNP